MKKYFISILCLMLLAAFLPLNIQAKSDEATLYYSYPEKLDAATMAKAQSISLGQTVQVDLTTADYKVYKIAAAARQPYYFYFDEYSSLGEPPKVFYKADGTREDIYNSMLYSTTAATYYMVVYNYSDYPGTTSFTVRNAIFSDNVTKKFSEETYFIFRPTATGTYAFTASSADVKNLTLELYDTDYEEYVNSDGKTNYKASVTASLKAGVDYWICVDGGYDNAKYTLTLTKSPAADAVISKIANLGTITASSGAAIDSARASYNALPASAQKLVSNIGTLTAAEKRYADLTKPSIATGKIKAAKSTKKKQATIKWKKVSGANGYQVAYSLKKSFKKAKTVKVSASKVKTTIKKLTRNKTYYVKVRAYKNYRGQTYYGSYSKVKKVKIK